MRSFLPFLLSALLAHNVTAFYLVQQPRAVAKTECALQPLFMGRAAAVRAATKSKTDAKKAKTNGEWLGNR